MGRPRRLVPLLLLLVIGEVGASSGAFRFEQGAKQAGLVFEHRAGVPGKKRFLVTTIGSGVVVADLNGDGHLDIYLVNGGTVPHRPSSERLNRLFFGDGAGNFRRGPAGDPAEDGGFGFGAVAGDYDGDGDLDLYICNWGPNLLLRNRGDGSFEDVTDRAGVGDPRWSSAAAFGDLDGDGLLDLYVGNYFQFGSEASMKRPRTVWSGIRVAPGPQGETAEQDRLYRNRGDGTFEEISEAAGILSQPAGYALAVTLVDLDQDGLLDVYVANDSTPNTYWHNEGKGRFRDLGLETGLAYSGEGHAQAGMGIAIERLNGDDVLDVVVTNFARDFNTYYESGPAATYQDRTHASGLAASTFSRLSFGVVAEDFDLDGHLDLFFANGHIYPEVDEQRMATTYAQKNQVFRGLGDGTFVDQVGRSGPAMELPAVSRGLATGDLDEDGRVDLVINNLDGPPHLLWNRSPPAGHWLAVRLKLQPGGGVRVGTVVTVSAGGRKWQRDLRAGGSFASSSSTDLVFGLGQVTRIDEVTIRFPDGETRTLRDVKPDQLLVIDRGKPRP